MATVWKPLKDQQIRLLAVVPGSNPNDMHFTFRRVSLTKPIPYTAVSYAWNHAAGYEVIHVDNKVVLIKRNLWKCLQRLRLLWSCIWADAICIDQSNVEERNDQVGLMGKIYANAAVVSVWLGDIVQDHVLPSEVLRERQTMNVPGVHNRVLVPPLASFIVDHPVATLDDDDVSQDLAHSIHDIARATYWRRTWVVQEFLLARKIHIYWGDAQIDEAVFRAVLLEQPGVNFDTTKSMDPSNKQHLVEECPPPRLSNRAAAQDSRADETAEERAMLDRCFPNYHIDSLAVALVALAHLKHFAGGKPLRPLVRALKVDTAFEVAGKQLLFHLLQSFDHVRSSDPAAEGHNLVRKSRRTQNPDMEDCLHKLEQPGMTLDGLYGNVCSSKDSDMAMHAASRTTKRHDSCERLEAEYTKRPVAQVSNVSQLLKATSDFKGFKAIRSKIFAAKSTF